MSAIETLALRPIGIIHTPFQNRSDAPHQGRLSAELCEIDVFEEYSQGLMDIEKCSHLIVLYWFDKADREKLTAIPPRNGRIHGVFATRSPDRPNPIAFDVAEFLFRAGNKIVVKGLDALEGSLLLDIKPYFSEIDCIQGAKVGWRVP